MVVVGKRLQHLRGMVEGHPGQSPVRERELPEGFGKLLGVSSPVNVMIKFVFLEGWLLVAVGKLDWTVIEHA